MLDNTVKNINILYVDDEQQNLDSFYAAFRKHYNIFTATSAKSAIEILRNHEIAVIITDQRMPEMTGIQFLEAIIPEYPNPIRMFMTGYSDAEVNTLFQLIFIPWFRDISKNSSFINCINDDIGIAIASHKHSDRVWVFNFY